MNIAFLIFERMTALDFIGFYDPVTRLKKMGFLPELRWDICAYTPEVHDDGGLGFTPSSVGKPLNGYDLIFVPGGFGTRTLIHDHGFIEWVSSVAPVELKTSVCSGSLVLGAAGFLEGRTATTHPNAFDELRPFCAEVADRRIVDGGAVITARGVTAPIDLGLYICEKLAGYDVRERIRRQMDYHPGEAET
jgi:transcriptional regulator GlxA family with amidase domain